MTSNAAPTGRWQGKPVKPSQASPVEIKRAFKSFQNRKNCLEEKRRELEAVTTAINADTDALLNGESKRRPRGLSSTDWRRVQDRLTQLENADRRYHYQRERVRGLLLYASSNTLYKINKNRANKHREVWNLFKRGVEEGIVEATDELLAQMAASPVCEVRSEALQMLVDRNICVIKKLARQNTKLDPEWAEVRAVEGVWLAAQKFDPNKGVKFATYAYNWIFRETRTRTKADRREAKMPLNPDDPKVISLNVSRTTTDEPKGLTDFLANESAPDPVASDFFNDLNDCLDEVEAQAQEVFTRKAVHGESYERIAEDLGLSRFQVRTIYGKIREQLQEKLADYVE